jgi:N-acetylglutamate synthase-like GNAT family acetyltransferase
MIRRCDEKDFLIIYEIINDAALAYKGVIPESQWKEPYMSEESLRSEMAKGVSFFCYEEKRRIKGVMGIQPVKDVILIRHAYVRREYQHKGIGGKLLACLLAQTDAPVLIGTWKAAEWAIRFYEKYSFVHVSEKEKNKLLDRYWTIPAEQKQASVVLCDSRWRDTKEKG